MRTIVTFQSLAFNVSEPREHYVTPNGYGDDVAKWLIARLRQDGIGTDDEPGQEDFGWYFDFGVPKHCCVIAYRPAAGSGTWVAWIERTRGLLGSLLGGRRRGIERDAVTALHHALAHASEITNVRWHLKADFDAGREALGQPSP